MAGEVSEAVRTVLAVREYSDKPVPDDVMRRVLDAAHLTGSSINLQPWHFVLVRDRAQLRKLAEMISTGRYIASASAAVVVAYERDNEWGVSDASRAIQSMVLTAWADGVGSNWTGFTGMEDVREMVGLPDKFDVVGVIPFGYPKRK